MNDKQKAMRAQLDKLSKENNDIQKRRTEVDEELAEERKAEIERKGLRLGPGRELIRMGSPGTPRGVIFTKKMAIPKKRKR